MILTKIHSDECDVCQSLGDSAKGVAEENGFTYEKVDLNILARSHSALRDYIVHYHVSGVDGMIDLPLYVISTDSGSIQGSSVVETLEEVANLIESWKQWESSQKRSSAD